MLRTDQGVDKGPKQLSELEFNQKSLRCGRVLFGDQTQHMWRWTGFHFGKKKFQKMFYDQNLKIDHGREIVID